MSKIVWDKIAERFFETGVQKGVHYLAQPDGTYGKGVPWNGLTGISESPSGAEPTALWADNIKYLTLISAEEYGGTITAYTYPDQFAECDGSAEVAPGVYIGQQNRKVFGLCYRTEVGNGVDGNEHAYKLHFIYGAQVSPTDKEHSTINDSPEAIEFSWEFSTTPVNVTGFKPTASMELDTRNVDKDKLTALEEILYGKDPTTEGGSDGVEPRLPLPDEIIALMGAGTGVEP